MDMLLDLEFFCQIVVFLGHFVGHFVDFVAEQIVVRCFGSYVWTMNLGFIQAGGPAAA